MELLTKPGVGGIIEKHVGGKDYILIQDRCKDDAKAERGLLEIPAGKIREFENIFDCLRREILEETGLIVTSILGEEDTMVYETNGYKVLGYHPFTCSQNLHGTYPILVHIFICKATGELLDHSNETRNIRWIDIMELKNMLENDKSLFYPMHVITLERYIAWKLMD